MSEFSATDAAFEGFRVARERPWAIVAWAGVALAMSLAKIVLILNLADVAAIDEALKLTAAGNADPRHISELMSRQLPYIAALIPISLLYYGIMFAAAFRVVIEPKSAENGLQVGVQELRQTWLIIVIAAILFIAYIGMLFIGLLLATLAQSISKPLGGVVGFLVTLTWFGLSIYVPIRLSLAGPQTFTEHRLRPFNSWALTAAAGSFWPIAGAYVLATAFAVIVVLLGMSVMAGVMAISGQAPGHPLGAVDLDLHLSERAVRHLPHRLVDLFGHGLGDPDLPGGGDLSAASSRAAAIETIALDRTVWSGFRLAREHPAAFGLWVVVDLILGLGPTALVMALLGPNFFDIVRSSTRGPRAGRRRGEHVPDP